MHTIVVGQSGGATPVINASLAGVIAEAARTEQTRVLGLQFGVRGLLEQRFVPLHDLSRQSLEALRDTPSAALGLCRYKLSDAELEEAVAKLRVLNVDAFLYIGGNDSAETTQTLASAAAVAGLDTRFIAVPKTIDNDLPGMDHTPGYGSAARFIAVAVRDLGLDAWAMQREESVRILEVYGRDTGWLAAAAMLARSSPADPPHLILLPEQPFREGWFLNSVSHAVHQHGFCTVVVGEMLRNADGTLVGRTYSNWRDAFGHAETRRPGEYLRALVQTRLGLRAKDDRPGSIQKVCGNSVSLVDRAEAFFLGEAAVRAARIGMTSVMVGLERTSDVPYSVELTHLPLDEIAGKIRPVPKQLLDQFGQPSDEFARYARPLVGAALPVRAKPLTASDLLPSQSQ
ncbi:MAG: diphosphate--fructose-6-phosphate 1-phosphotransferase [Chloroflexi bacterium]|nr:diphosphate--fructose-6-phosphate 1-phosphotransferase [Chloroflexota bacterium]